MKHKKLARIRGMVSKYWKMKPKAQKHRSTHSLEKLRSQKSLLANNAWLLKRRLGRYPFYGQRFFTEELKNPNQNVYATDISYRYDQSRNSGQLSTKEICCKSVQSRQQAQPDVISFSWRKKLKLQARILRPESDWTFWIFCITI